MRMHFALHALPIACPKFVLLDRYSRAEWIGDTAVLHSTFRYGDTLHSTKNAAKHAWQIGSRK